MATKAGTTTTQHVHLRADDPTTEALATFLIREDQQSLREALLTAASLVAIARRFSTWVAANPTTPTPTDLYEQLEVPHGFHYFERTAPVPVIDEAPTWHNYDERPGTEPAEPPHAAIVRQVVDDHTNTLNLALATASAVAIVAVLLKVLTNHLDLEQLRPWSTWGLVITTAAVLSLAFGRHVARMIGRTANDRILGHDSLQAARSVRLQIEESTPWATLADLDHPVPVVEAGLASCSEHLDSIDEERPVDIIDAND